MEGISLTRINPIAVTPLEDHFLLIVFSNNEHRLFDVKPYINGSWNGKLADEGFFKTVRVAGNTVEWADGQDIAPHEMYELPSPHNGFSFDPYSDP